MSQPPNERPTQALRNEHQSIVRVLAVLQRLTERAKQGAGFEVLALGQCVEFFRLFADACHHAKEEDLLFPMLESLGILKDGGPIGVMLYEHKIARELTRQLADTLERVAKGDATARSQFCAVAEQYIGLLSSHIAKEDNVLFAMGDRVMRESDQQTLCTKLCEVSCRSFGGKKREELTRMAEALAAEWTDDR